MGIPSYLSLQVPSRDKVQAVHSLPGVGLVTGHGMHMQMSFIEDIF